MNIRDIVLIGLVPIVLIVVVTVFGYFEGAVDHSSLSTDASTAVNDTASQTYNAFDMATVIPIVVIAVIIIGLLLKSFLF